MTLAILDVETHPPRYPYDVTPDRPVVVASFAGGGAEQRSALLSRSLRRYRLSWRCQSTRKDYLLAFFEARGYRLESFLLRDFQLYQRTGVALGTAVASQVAFEVPDTGTNGGDYPIDDSNVEVYEDGVATAAAITVGTDARTLTLDTAPGAGVVMTADYWFYRRVRLASDLAISQPTLGTWVIGAELQEVAANG